MTTDLCRSGNRCRWRVGTVLALIAIFAGQALNAAPQDAISRFDQLNRLPKEEASRGKSVRLKTVVVCYDPGWGQLYFHDGTATEWFNPGLFHRQFEVGDVVEVIGITMSANGIPGLTNLQASVVGRERLPPAKPLQLPEFAKDFGQWVETSGSVRVADTSWGRLALVIEAGGRSCLVYVMNAAPVGDGKRFVGTRVRIRGINASTVKNKQLVKASLFAPGTNEITILQPADLEFERVPVSAVGTLFDLELGPWTNRMVHLNGNVSAYKPGDHVEIRDPTGTIHAEVVQKSRLQPDQRVDLWGFPSVSATGLTLKDAYFEAMGPPTEGQAGTPSASVAPPSHAAPTLTQVSEVVRLSKKEAAGGAPVRLRGVITYADPEWHNAFFGDASGELYVETSQRDVRSGQWVEVRGRTSAGGFTPDVVASTIEILGTTNLPAPAKADLAELANGHLDAHWVELEGVVRRVTEEWSHLTLSVTTPKGQFKAILPSPKGAELPMNLIDSFVSIRGACGAQLNLRGQLAGITLHVPGLDQIQMIEAAPADPFAGLATPVAALATFDPERVAGRRVKIRGEVVLVSRLGFYVQDSTGGVRVEGEAASELHPGDQVDVLGFVALGDFSPHLEEAIFRRSAGGKLPQPKRTTAAEILVEGTNDASLVEMEAQLVQDVLDSARPKLVLQDGPILFTAVMEHSGLGYFPAWKAGSLLHLRGVCSIQGTEAKEPDTFKLLVAAPKDVVLVRAASWWTARHTFMLVGGLAVGIAAATGWIFLLRRQVRVQTEVIERNQKELMDISRQAGMAEVATSVLHNVGNVLTSVTVSTTLLAEQAKRSKVGNLFKAVELLRQHEPDLGAFLTNDAKGKRLPDYLLRLAEHLGREQKGVLEESELLQKNIEHIREIVAMQQNYAKVLGVAEPLRVTDLIEDALRMNQTALDRHGVKVVRQYEEHLPKITVERNKVLQILVNLVHNAKYACSACGRPERELNVHVWKDGGRLRISVADNGIGIPAENLTRIFNHGFTTRKGGHGFGLHSGALAANEMGGSLQAQSEGPGRGAKFTLELPIPQEN